MASADSEFRDATDLESVVDGGLAARQDISSSREECIPDGGYGWVIVVCIFACNAASWGMNTSYGVYLAYYIENSYFEGASQLGYAFVGGLSVACAYGSAPLVNFLVGKTGLRPPMILGMIFVSLGQCLAALSRKFGAFIFFQGVMFGLGKSNLLTPGRATQPLLSHWFDKRLSLAQGITSCGSGFGGLILANTTRATLASVGLQNTLIINGCISCIVLLPSIFLIKARKMQVAPRIEPLQFRWLWHRNFLFVWTWGATGVMGYFIALYSLASYATDGLGLSQTEGAALQSILSAGQVIGRPLLGMTFDKAGRFNMATLATLLAGVTCVAIWLPSRSFAVLVVFSVIQGAVGGTAICITAPIATSAVGLLDVGSALAMFWLMTVVPSLAAQPIAVLLINYSRQSLGREGADAYAISIGFCGALFCLSGVMIFGAKVRLQGNFKLLKKT
ncbi:UM00103-like protein [Sarocladium strictum]